MWQQYYILQGRALWAYTRNPANVAGRSLMTIAIAVIEGAAFMRVSSGRSTTFFVVHISDGPVISIECREMHHNGGLRLLEMLPMLAPCPQRT